MNGLMMQVTLNLEHEEYKILRQIADQEGLTVSGVILDILRCTLKESTPSRKKDWPENEKYS